MWGLERPTEGTFGEVWGPGMIISSLSQLSEGFWWVEFPGGDRPTPRTIVQVHFDPWAEEWFQWSCTPMGEDYTQDLEKVGETILMGYPPHPKKEILFLEKVKEPGG